MFSMEKVRLDLGDDGGRDLGDEFGEESPPRLISDGAMTFGLDMATIRGETGGEGDGLLMMSKDMLE